jgi:signal transduction histidine kinase
MVAATAGVLAIATALFPDDLAFVVPVSIAVLGGEIWLGCRLLRRARHGAAPHSRAGPRRERPKLRTGRPVATAMLAVVVSFSVSLAYSHFRLRRIDDDALEILRDATPSLDHLCSIRGELWRLASYVNQYVDGVNPEQAKESIIASRTRLGAELEGYQSLPNFSGRVGQVSEVVTDLALVDDALDKLFANGGGRLGDLVLHQVLDPRLERTDSAVERLRVLNASYVRYRAARILEARRQGMFVANGLGVLSVIVAVVASALVTRSLRARARLLEEHDQLVAARATELEDFAGRVAHDLKNPLGVVALRVLSSQRRFDMSPELRANLEKVARQVERMDHIIDGLLEFARAGAHPPPGSHANLGVVLEETLAELKPAADAVKAEVQVDPYSLAPSLEVGCSPSALGSVISNLVGNAVKYVVEGRHPTRFIAIDVYDLVSRVRVEVRDNGPGLPPGSEDVAFEPFRRLGDTKQPGIGLGLATVKKIVESYGGKVGVHSRVGEGSSFWFELPKVEPPIPA